ncbi:MAG: response regulator receiver [bacterium]|nr:MAG: response regulator receiver [bacterium]KAF0150451.1 MAG: response regulator receiver [bacterium]KAF0169008.1 MAG: response regulator receiver [bacterium]TXT32808.1 MAG: response regulator receiver [Rhodocyclaceae bacterium]
MTFWQKEDLPASPPASSESGKINARLLIIEDDRTFATSMQRLLTHAGYRTEAVENGLDGLETLAATRPDLLLVDINLPDMTGHEVIRAARDKGLTMPVIVVSGESEIDAAILALRLGAMDYVRKPIEPEILLYAVARALAQRCLEREHKTARQRVDRSEKLHRFLVDAAPDVIFILDETGKISYVNQRLHELLGVEEKQVIGRHFSRLVHDHDQKRARYAFSARKLAETARHSIELRLKSGLDHAGFRHFEVSLAAVGMPEEQAGESDDQAHYYGVARDVTAHREAEALTLYQANHDALTGLPNRNLFRDHLGLALIQARRNQGRIAVLFLNLDRFKHVNDLIGHAKADELLREVGERIQRCLRGGDTLARFVGDEFLLLTPCFQHEGEVLDLVERINQELTEPFRNAGRSIHLSISAGIAMYPEHGESADALIRHANIALYHGRLAGSNTHSFFMREMGESADQRLKLQSELRYAIRHDQFELYYQPQVDIGSGRVKGVEALVRWNHPELGLLPPGEFLPLAEEADLIGDLGEWVIRSACKTLRNWFAQGIAPPRVAINISPQHLDEADFVERFVGLLEEYQIEPARIEVELTENLFIRDPHVVAEKLHSLAAHGVMIAIDDFGTQYSSLSYLQKFPIHTLKIDKSFVWEIDREYRQHAIIKAIISIAHGLGLNLIAEGVETDEQLRFLENQGCDEIQGYLISKPLKREALESLLTRGLEIHPAPQ